MRKTTIPLLTAVLLTAAGIARAEIVAQEIPSDQVQQFSTQAAQFIEQQFPNPPVKIEANSEKALGYYAKIQNSYSGVAAIPDKRLTAKAIEEVGEKDTPAGMVILMQLQPMDKEQAVTKEKLAVADILGVAKVALVYLDVRKKGDDRVLEVYSRENKPLLTVPLKKKEGLSADQPVGLKLANIDPDKKKADLTINLAGAYTAEVKLAVAEL